MIGAVFNFSWANQMTEDRANESIINLEEALVVTAGDREMLISLGELFLEEGPKHLLAVREQMEASDAKGIRDAAHTLKGSVAIFGASRATAAAFAVEQAATQSDLSCVSDALTALDREMRLLLCEVDKLCHE